MDYHPTKLIALYLTVCSQIVLKYNIEHQENVARLLKTDIAQHNPQGVINSILRNSRLTQRAIDRIAGRHQVKQIF